MDRPQAAVTSPSAGLRDPLAQFKPLSPAAFLYEPPERQGHAVDANAATSPPRLVVLFTWYAAEDIHIAKYTSQWLSLYPSSRILVVKCPASHSIIPFIAKRDMRPAVHVLEAAAAAVGASEQAKRPEVVFHVFSNGGATNLTAFLDLWAEANKTSSSSPDTGKTSSQSVPLPPHVMILDSSPGAFHFQRTHRALVAGLPAILSPVMYLMLGIYWLMHVPLGRPMALELMMNALNSKETVLRNETTRLYVYSEDDSMVWWPDVEGHAKVAEENGAKSGLAVKMEKFVGSGHVGHARVDAERYWRAVREAWETR